MYRHVQIFRKFLQATIIICDATRGNGFLNEASSGQFFSSRNKVIELSRFSLWICSDDVSSDYLGRHASLDPDITDDYLKQIALAPEFSVRYSPIRRI